MTFGYTILPTDAHSPWPRVMKNGDTIGVSRSCSTSTSKVVGWARHGLCEAVGFTEGGDDHGTEQAPFPGMVGGGESGEECGTDPETRTQSPWASGHRGVRGPCTRLSRPSTTGCNTKQCALPGPLVRGVVGEGSLCSDSPVLHCSASAAISKGLVLKEAQERAYPKGGCTLLSRDPREISSWAGFDVLL